MQPDQNSIPTHRAADNGADLSPSETPRSVCRETSALFSQFVTDKRDRQSKHVALIEAEARRLGRAVAMYEVTTVDACARLERLCNIYDTTVCVPLRMVPLAEGRATAIAAFWSALAVEAMAHQ